MCTRRWISAIFWATGFCRPKNSCVCLWSSKFCHKQRGLNRNLLRKCHARRPCIQLKLPVENDSFVMLNQNGSKASPFFMQMHKEARLSFFNAVVRRFPCWSKTQKKMMESQAYRSFNMTFHYSKSPKKQQTSPSWVEPITLRWSNPCIHRF